MSKPRKFIIVPEEAMERVELESALDEDGEREEGGRVVRQPTVVTGAAPSGDIRPSVEGDPERHFDSKLAPVSPGVVEDARWSWGQNHGQLRQSPHVVHRAPALVQRKTDRYIVGPKLLPLVSGGLMCVWVESDWMPQYQTIADEITIVRQKVFYSICSAETSLWSSPTEITEASDVLSEDNDLLLATWDGELAETSDLAVINGFDLVQFPDTGQIQLVLGIQSQSNITGEDSASDETRINRYRRISVLVSESDGSSWVERSRNQMNGEFPDISLEHLSGSNSVYDASAISSLAVERLPSGRLVMCLLTRRKVWSLVSDDRGATWTPHYVSGTDSNHLPGHSVGSAIGRNGVAMFVIAFRKSSQFPNIGAESDNWGAHITTTADGESWSTRQYVASDIEATDVAVAIGPEGWPHVYGTAHAFQEFRTLPHDGLGRTYQFRGEPGELVLGIGTEAGLSEIGGGLTLSYDQGGPTDLFDLDPATVLLSDQGGRFTFGGRAVSHRYYNGWTLAATGGTGSGQTYKVAGYSSNGYFLLDRAWDAAEYVYPDQNTTFSLSPPNEGGAGWVRVRFLHPDVDPEVTYENWRVLICEGTGAGQFHYVSNVVLDNTTSITAPAAVVGGNMNAPFYFYGGDYDDLVEAVNTTSGSLSDFFTEVQIKTGAVFVDVVQPNDADGALRDAINDSSTATGIVASLDSDNRLVLTSDTSATISLYAPGSNALAIIGGFSQGPKTGEPVIQASLAIQDGQVTPDATSGYVLFDDDEARQGDLILVNGYQAVLRHSGATGLTSVDLSGWTLSVTGDDSYTIISSRQVVEADFDPGGVLEDFEDGLKDGGLYSETVVQSGDLLVSIDDGAPVNTYFSTTLTGGDLDDGDLGADNDILKPWSFFPARKHSYLLHNYVTGVRDWMWGRRLSSRDPSLGWTQPHDFMPVPKAVVDQDGNFSSIDDDEQAKFAPFAFHIPPHTRQRNGQLASSAPSGWVGSEEFERPAFSGNVFIDAVEWRGQIVLVTVFQQDSEGTIQANEEQTINAETDGVIADLLEVGSNVVADVTVVATIGGVDQKSTVSGELTTIEDNPGTGSPWEDGESIGSGDPFFSITPSTPIVTPALNYSALMAYRLNGFQALRERLPSSSPTTTRGRPARFPAFPAGGCIYNHVWDCHGLPADLGWASVGGDGEIQSDENGRLKIIDAVGDANYFTVPLDWTTDLSGTNGYQIASRDFVMRAVFRLVSDDEADIPVSAIVPVGFRICNSSASGVATVEDAGCDVGLSFTQIAGGNIQVRLVNFGDDTSYDGAVLLGNHDDWIEVVFAGRYTDLGTHLFAYARQWVAEVDPDWSNEWVDALSGISSLDRLIPNDQAVLPFARFGHPDDVPIDRQQTSYWKTFQVARGWSMEHPVPLELPGVTDSDDEDGSNITASSGGEAIIDSGIDNYVRASRTTFDPAQFVRDGVSVRWRGEAITPGQFDFDAGYVHGAGKVMTLPSLEEWRSRGAETNKVISLLFDAGSGRGFRPDALAMFGRNFPTFRVGFGTTSSANDHQVYFGLSRWGISGSYDQIRVTDHWTFDATSLGLTTGRTWKYVVEGRRITVESGADRGPWIPHQYRSDATGRRWYVCAQPTAGQDPIVSESSPIPIYEIEDNTEDTLILKSAITTSDFVHGTGNDYATVWNIFSDCIAAEFGGIWAEDDDGYDGIDGLIATSAHKTFRYMKIDIANTVFRDSAARFARLGHMMLGRAIDLDNPQPDWGWGVDYVSGEELIERKDGSVFASRKSALLRRLKMDYAVLRPPATLVSYDRGKKRNWLDFDSTLRRLRLDGVPVTLVFEQGENAPGGGAADPVVSGARGIMLARLDGSPSMAHVAYDCDDTDAPPHMALRGLVFKEQL